MTEHAICFKCIEDEVLRATVESEGEPLLCESCGEENTSMPSPMSGLARDWSRSCVSTSSSVRLSGKFDDDDQEGLGAGGTRCPTLSKWC